MSDKVRLELLNLRKRVEKQREEINRLQEKIKGLQPKFGFWDVSYDESEHPLFQRKWSCSACGDWNTYGRTPYCPNCGAKMHTIVHNATLDVPYCWHCGAKMDKGETE